MKTTNARQVNKPDEMKKQNAQKIKYTCPGEPKLDMDEKTSLTSKT